MNPAQQAKGAILVFLQGTTYVVNNGQPPVFIAK